ncbi:rRNA maturation RNase YbeY [Synechococcus sp. HJ21-Hayes]|jgi:probable rRNA maturation factor|uniref:rRNA maturation RNase YbeY n=1 Tax=unclassified Synechococcus TaxID=2626047 RepID=UPI0020CDCCEF|nr:MULTISPECIES: rRNA maturation RNase YbeY [unclassified Synechococcus]MCP9830487.1 rRNA maturation RNase YbeY [Synechococcus sp. JJ3a-Johnson]MCP9852322.1 rRNA maturation RNase YbeY [Synechococcus sp. HJ21-Hayes]
MAEPAAPLPDLDLAFEADDSLPAELLTAAGAMADPLAGAELWHGFISTWLAQLASDLPESLQAPAYSLGLSLVGDTEIAALNQDWRDKTGPTDVLAFAAQDDGLDDAPPMPSWANDERDEDALEPLELGDIVISLETAARQAPDHGYSLREEVLFLATHGLLHLVGWDHPDDSSLAAMLARQEQLLATGQQR